MAQKLLLFWRKPAVRSFVLSLSFSLVSVDGAETEILQRKCWWDATDVILNEGTTEAREVKVWARRVWTLELSLVRHNPSRFILVCYSRSVPLRTDMIIFCSCWVVSDIQFGVYFCFFLPSPIILHHFDLLILLFIPSLTAITILFSFNEPRNSYRFSSCCHFSRFVFLFSFVFLVC